MAYKKKNFENGHILTAEDLNYIETGIEAAHEATDNFNVDGSNITPTFSYLTIQKDGELYEIPVLRSDSGQDGEHQLRHRHLPMASAYRQGAVIVDLQMSDVSQNPVQNATIKMYVDNSIYESLKDVLKGNVTGDAPVRRFELTNGYMIPILEDEKLKPMHLPLATEYQRGAITSEDKVALDQLKKLLSNEVVEGTYGETDRDPNGLIYNIPNITVDEYGRVVAASNSVLPYASVESDGYITSDDYKKIADVPSVMCNSGLKILAGETKPTSSYYDYWYLVYDPVAKSDIYKGVKYEVWGIYTDGTAYYQIPIECEVKTELNKSGDAYVWHIYPHLPEPIEYDVTCYCKGTTQPISITM